MAMNVAERTTRLNVAQEAKECQHFALHDVSWSEYELFLKAVGDRPVFLTYDRGSLQIMSPGSFHSRYAEIIGRLLDVLTEEWDLPCLACGNTTFRRKDLKSGLEPDKCYYIANAERMTRKAKFDLKVDPPPDLAVEVDITRSSKDRMGIYAALGVPELWRFDGEDLQIHRLSKDGKYEGVEQSPTFPELPVKELVEYIRQGVQGPEHNTLIRAFRKWVRSVRKRDE